MPLQATSGAASYDSFGGGVPVVPAYIEEVFSTFLYTGNATARSIVNNIDISGNDGLVWTKTRSYAGLDHYLVDTVRGKTKYLNSNGTGAEVSTSDITAFNSDGYSLNSDVNGGWNNNGSTFVSWTFRKQPKFFDVVTFTGTGSVQTIAHSLGSVPGCIMVKKTSGTGAWYIYHRGLVPTSAPSGTTAPENYVTLNGSGSVQTLSTIWNNTDPTSTVFTVGSSAEVNASGASFVAYIFAHNAGGFGLTGTDNVITCGNYRGLGSPTGPVINLGFEPQWLLVKGVKDISGAENWYIVDNVRPWDVDGNKKDLSPNTSTAETDNGSIKLTSTGFQPNGNEFNESSVGYIYMAIRRGPMKVPTTGTSVYNAVARTGTGAAATITGVGFAPDWWHCFRKTGSLDHPIVDRLRGNDSGLYSNLLQAQDSLGGNPTFSTTMDGVSLTTLTGGNFNGSGSPYINHFFKRSPSVFDICCYSGSGIATTQTHNLGAVPQLIIVKRRNTSGAWDCYSAFLANTDYVALSSANGSQTNTDRWDSTSPTSTVFTVGTSTTTNASGSTYVAYLFATAAGVSKCFSYTGNGSSQTINCGFTSSARFILIKRTDSTGDWYVWDTTRGIAAGNDPHISFNTTAAEVTTDDTIDTDSTGFVVNQLSATDVNVSSATYIGLAIA